MKRFRLLRSVVAVCVVFNFLFSIIAPSIAVSADLDEILRKETLSQDSGKLPKVAAEHPGALSDYFEGQAKDIYNAYHTAIDAISEGFRGSILYTPVYTVKKDTSITGDDNNRNPALDIFRENGLQFRVPAGKKADADKIGYEYFVLPIIVPSSSIPGKLSSYISEKDEKGITNAVIKYLSDVLGGNVNTVEDQMRSSVLKADELGNLAWDKTSTIAVMTKKGDILIQVPFWIKYEEIAMKRLAGDLQTGIKEITPVVDSKWAENPSISKHEDALKFLTTNAWHFFDEFSKGDYTHVDLLISIINTIDVTKIVNPEGIVYDPVLGVFKSEKDADAKIPYFGKNLESFLASLNTTQQLVQLLYFLAVPVYESGNAIAVPDEKLQEAVAGLYYKAYRHFDDISTARFNDPVVFEPIRMEIGRFADALNSAVRNADAVSVNSTKPSELFAYIESKGINLSTSEKEAITRMYKLYEGENGQWLYDILQLSEVLSLEHFVSVMKYLMVGDARKVLPQDKPLEVFDGTGRIGTMGLALRLSGDVNNKVGEYLGRYGVRTRALKPKGNETKLAAAAAVIEEMFSDSVIAASELALKTRDGTEVPIAQLLDQKRLVFQAGDTALNAQQDFGVTAVAEAVYPVNILLDNELIAKVYVIDVSDYEEAVKGQVTENNIPRPFIVQDGEKEVVFSVLTDATPGGVWIGDGAIERLLDPKDYEKMTAWQLAGVEILPQSGLATLKRLASDESMQAIDKIKDGGLKQKVKELVNGIKDRIDQGLSAESIMATLGKEDITALQKGIKESKTGKQILGDAKEELERLVELLQQIDSIRIKNNGMLLDYNKAQIAKKLLLPLSGGIHFMGRYIHKLPMVKEEGASYYTPTSCSTNGASYFGMILSTLCGCGTTVNSIMGITFHMYTSGDTKGIYGDLDPKSTGAAKGVSQHFPVTALFTAVRTPTGLKDGKHDIVGGSAFYFLVQLQNPINRDVLVRFFNRVGAEYPEILRIFSASDKQNGEYTWARTIGGQRTGSIVYEDLIEQIAPNTFSAVVGYDNEMSFSFKMRENGDARDLALKRQRDKRRRYLDTVFSRIKGVVASNEKVSVDLDKGESNVGSSKESIPTSVTREVVCKTGIISKNFINPNVQDPAYGKRIASKIDSLSERIRNLMDYFGRAMSKTMDRIGGLFTKIPEDTTYMIRGDQILFDVEIVQDEQAKKLHDANLYQTVNVRSAAIGIAKTLAELKKKKPKAKVLIYSPNFTISQSEAILDAIDAGGFTNVVLRQGDTVSVYNSLGDEEKKKVVIADIERHDGLNARQVVVSRREEGKTLHHMPFFNLMVIISAYASGGPTQFKLADSQVEEIISIYRMWLELPENGYDPSEIDEITKGLRDGLAQDKPYIPLPLLPKAESLLKALDVQYSSGIETYA